MTKHPFICPFCGRPPRYLTDSDEAICRTKGCAIETMPIKFEAWQRRTLPKRTRYPIPTSNPPDVEEVRCASCGDLLFKGSKDERHFKVIYCGKSECAIPAEDEDE